MNMNTTSNMGMNSSGMGMNSSGMGMNRSGMSMQTSNMGMNRSGMGMHTSSMGMQSPTFDKPSSVFNRHVIEMSKHNPDGPKGVEIIGKDFHVNYLRTPSQNQLSENRVSPLSTNSSFAVDRNRLFPTRNDASPHHNNPLLSFQMRGDPLSRSEREMENGQIRGGGSGSDGRNSSEQGFGGGNR